LKLLHPEKARETIANTWGLGGRHHSRWRHCLWRIGE
jgi:hypothetical protein